MNDNKITELSTPENHEAAKKPSDPFFTKQFNHYYKVLWLDKGRTDKEFREKVADCYKERTGEKIIINKNSMTQWKHGTYSRKYIIDIAHALGFKDESIFNSDGNPEYDERMQHELDQVRFEYAREIGLDKNFMLFILHTFTGAEWGRMDFFYYLKKHESNERFPDEKSDFGSIYDEISKETLASLQCRFKGIPEGEEGDNYLIHLPKKGDLDYMLFLQKQVEQHIQVHLNGLHEMIEMDMYKTMHSKGTKK